MLKMFVPVAAVSLLALAGCNKAPDSAATVPPATQDNGTTTVQIEVPEALAPAVEAVANPQQTLQSLQDQAGSMSEQMKRDAVAAARKAAQDGARAMGQTEPQILEAGNVAETTTKRALGLE